MHLILCIWLPFYRPCSFASQTFIWFADFLIIALILCKKLILLSFNAQLYTRKIYRFNARKTKKNSRYIYPNCSSTSEVHAALTLLFPAPWFFPVTTGKFPTAAIIYIYWYHAFHTKMLFYPQYTSLSASNYTSFPLLHVLIVPVIMKKY